MLPWCSQKLGTENNQRDKTLASEVLAVLDHPRSKFYTYPPASGEPLVTAQESLSSLWPLR